uniref:AAA+ ATPase domain-containing protein n=1 Tax=viral metagenome TaxID=1070528 RepID=A0A6C0B7Q5_9ZZZZ
MTTKLIDILDKYRDKQNIKYKEFSVLLNAIEHDYLETGLFNDYFLGKNLANDLGPFDNIAMLKNSYNIWKSTHEFDMSLNELLSLPSEVINKTKVQIDTEINTLSDLLDIIEKYECKADIEYNIDVKLLHNIKSELTQLNNMIGMENVKKSVLDQLIYFMQDLHINKKTSEYKHTVIAGPPGTGKTEVAKIIGAMYSKVGILKKNHFKKVTRSDLIAGYLGQTAIKTRKVIDECIGGVLFIDEAYSLANETDIDIFSKECIDTLCEALSDQKDNLMVIIAGYETELQNTFFKANRGLDSRFMWRFVMDDYTYKEMMAIFKKKVLDEGWEFLEENALKEIWFREKKDEFKNFGRDMEQLLSCVKIKHGRRVYGKSSDVKKKITIDDMNNGYLLFQQNQKKEKKSAVPYGVYI